MWHDDEDAEERQIIFPGSYYLEVNGQRIEQLSQFSDNVSEPLTDAERLDTMWDDFGDALACALRESFERGGVPIDVCSGGRMDATVIDRAAQRPELKAGG